MSEGGDGPFCDMCGREFRFRRPSTTLPEDICSVSCMDKRQTERYEREAERDDAEDDFSLGAALERMEGE